MINFDEGIYAKMRKDKFTLERFRIMRDLAMPTEDRIIVDLGAGWNPVSEGLNSKKTIRVDGERTFNPDIVCDFNKEFTLEDNFADVIFAGEILEHLTNPFIFLKNIHRTLKKMVC